MQTNFIMNGDCLQHLKELPENSVDAIITDPPYGLSFMNKHWDYDVPSVEIWKECLRVLKHGGHLLSFAGTRTYHRMTCNIEDAGFEIRDMISWIYGSGFPKSLNIGKQIDKIQGNERTDIEYDRYKDGNKRKKQDIGRSIFDGRNGNQTTRGNSEWEGWGTALKPACEPIVVARKPLSEKNVALNVLKWGTGGINIDECRIKYDKSKEIDKRIINETNYRSPSSWSSVGSNDGWKREAHKNYEGNITYHVSQGRFPANVILDEEAGKILDEQSGISKSSDTKRNRNVLGSFGMPNDLTPEYSDTGGASRFFYCAKASKSERNLGLDDLPDVKKYKEDNSAQSHEIFSKQMLRPNPETGKLEPRKDYEGITKNNHPTVKPLKLMEYLVKLVTPKNGIVLDPFLGSGTTAIACIKLNRLWIGIEREAEYIKIAQARINYYSQQNKLDVFDEKGEST